MRPLWPKLASLAQEICILWFQFFDASFASKGYPFKNIHKNDSYVTLHITQNTLNIFSSETDDQNSK